MHTEKTLNRLIQKISSRKVVLFSLSAFVLVLVIVNLFFKKNFAFLTQTFNYSPEDVYQLLENIGESGRSQHLLVFFPDVLMVLLYSILLIGANYSIFNHFVKRCSLISVITFSPLLLSFVQLFEIALLAMILLKYPSQFIYLAKFANVITMAKTLLTVIFFSMPLAGLCIINMRKIVKRV